MMNQKLIDIFSRVFEVPAGDVHEIEYQSVPAWDSIGHMMMISELEDEFGISIEMEDVIVISNFKECSAIVTKYLG